MTNTVGIIVLLSTTACSPLMARNAKPTPGKNVNPKPTPKPIDRPFLSFPSSLTLPSSMMFCPSTAFVETHFTATDPGFPHPRAFCLSICNCTGVPRFISTFPSALFTSFSTIAEGLPSSLLVTCETYHQRERRCHHLHSGFKFCENLIDKGKFQ